MKLYSEMSATEQLQWVTEFSAFATDKLPLLMTVKNWDDSDRKDMEKGLRLIQAFKVSRKFAEDSLTFGDYFRRVSRLKFYVDLIKKDISKDMAVKGSDGEIYAYIPALQRRAKRGRPTREEVFQRKVNEQLAQAPETKTQEKIASLLGMTIITDKEAREKNNAELAAEREARREQEEKVSPSLFAQMNVGNGGNNPNDNGNENTTRGGNADNGTATGSDGSSNDGATEGDEKVKMPISATMPHLDQVKWLLPKDVQAMVDDVRNKRAAASANAERAKMLAEQGAKPEEIAEYAQKAQEATKGYEHTYECVDRELAKVWLRLREDESYLQYLLKTYQIKDTTDLQKQLRPYYNKVSAEDPLFTTSIRAWIAENNPEAVARREKAAETKRKADAIIKYLRRNDKLPTKKRIEGMREKYKELITLVGEAEAKEFLPFIKKTIEDNVEYEKQKLEKKLNKGKKVKE